MKAFLIIAAVALLFVLGPVLAMRPSPRQAQLARLRARAVAAGLRVRVSVPGGAEPLADYVLPWRLEDLETARGLRLRAQRETDGSCAVSGLDAPRADAVRAAWRALPPGVAGVRSLEEGLAAQWNEKGRDDDVDRIREALAAMREIALGAAPA